jgi:uncharacterized membrane-anchored protein
MYVTSNPETRGPTQSLGRQMLSKVPEVTLFFWVIKVLATTVGETAADYLTFSRRFSASPSL